MTTAPLADRPTPDYRSLPSVDELLRRPALRAGLVRLAPAVATDLAQAAIAGERARLAAEGGAADGGALERQVLASADDLLRPALDRVINATGVIIQTNLGRAPVSAATAAAMAEAASQYTPLEFDLATGRRGDRMAAVVRLLRRLTGAEDALVVNNNAAATLLMLTALAANGETIVSRGEAVEIGGGFRIPDVMAQSGTRLVEVGTTNRTHLADYERAIGPATAALLKVHPSNFRVIGFTASVDIATLSALATGHGLLTLDDLGSGALLDTATYGLMHEPMLTESVAAGAAVTCASGDKLLGGPQAGVLVGRRGAIERCRRHPLARAVRADKTCLAGLEATLRHYLAGEATAAIPVWRMIALPLDVIERRARAWQQALAGLGVAGATVRPDRSAVGGGSLPGETLPTLVLAAPLAGVPGGQEQALRRLRHGPPPLIARVADGDLLLDPRTVFAEDDAHVPALVAAALTGRA
ncbi:MAG: L-seryl-tRNA(Sec) selenium transferase [Chloroflexi bacterium]|nr:L-seryl-tRNA(Sec) selenium transferase [Chloroflexota bacterium]